MPQMAVLAYMVMSWSWQSTVPSRPLKNSRVAIAPLLHLPTTQYFIPATHCCSTDCTSNVEASHCLMVLGLAFGKIKNVFVGKFISEIKICWDFEIDPGQTITDSTGHGWVDFWHYTRPLEIDTLLRTAVIKKSWVPNLTGQLVSKLENGVDSKADPAPVTKWKENLLHREQRLA